MGRTASDREQLRARPQAGRAKWKVMLPTEAAVRIRLPARHPNALLLRMRREEPGQHGNVRTPRAPGSVSSPLDPASRAERRLTRSQLRWAIRSETLGSCTNMHGKSGMVRCYLIDANYILPRDVPKRIRPTGEGRSELLVLRVGARGTSFFLWLPARFGWSRGSRRRISAITQWGSAWRDVGRLE